MASSLSLPALVLREMREGAATMTDGWISWAIRRDGPPFKRYMETVNANEGMVCHSAEGWLAGTFGELDKTERSASWHFTNDLDGTLYQHYPLRASCWASGNFEANTKYVAMESIGTAAAPLTEAQVATALRLWRELGFTQKGVNLFQHNEVATRWTPNAGPTACPSGRYDAAFAALNEEEPMNQEEREEHEALVAIMGGRNKLLNNQRMGNDFILGYTLEQTKLAEHIDDAIAHKHKHHGFTGEPTAITEDN